MASDEGDVEALIAGRFPVIVIETHEESRALSLVRRAAARRGLTVRTWSVTRGLQTPAGTGALVGTQDPAVALRTIAGEREPGIVVLLDFHPFLSNPVHVRQIKEIAADYDAAARTVVLLGHQAEVPPEIAKLSARLELALPDNDAILRIVKEEVLAWQKAHDGADLKGEREVFDVFLRHLSGLTELDVRRLVRYAIQDDGLLGREDLPRVIRQKHTLLARDSVLSFEIDTARFADVAGLANLKAWLDRRRPVFLAEGDGAGLDVPKGIMLLGVQGCGKSLAAKAVAGAWSVPLMRLDFGALYNKYLGETGRNLREALKAADAMAPCILWIDEIEKGISTADGTSDGGESKRVLGTLLTWMAERKSRVFIVATSNDIEALPPELVRKGRLDEIFFVDLPDEAAREAIFRIHIGKRGANPDDIDLSVLIASTAGFSGAEIEQAVVAAQYEARANGVVISAKHLLVEVDRTKPLSVVMAERIAHLRLWAQDRTVNAD